MSTIRDQLIARMVTELNTARPVGVPEFERVMNRPKEPEQLPANVVYPVRESPVPVHNRRSPLVERTLTVRIEMRMIGNDSGVDPSHVWVTKTLMPSRLSNLCSEVNEDSVLWSFRRRAKPYCLCILDLTINYTTSRTDQERVS